MPVRIYDISKKLGLENKEVIAKAKELGITCAKNPSSSLDKITAEYLEEKLTGGKSVAPAAPMAPTGPEKIMLVTTPPPVPRLIPTGPQVRDKIGFIQLPTKATSSSDDNSGSVKLPPDRSASSGQLTKAGHTTPDTPKYVEPTNSQIITPKPQIMVRVLAEQLKRKPFQIQADLMELGVFASENHAIDEEIANKIRAKNCSSFEVESARDCNSPSANKSELCEESSIYIDRRETISPSRHGTIPKLPVIIDGLNVMNYCSNPSVHKLDLRTLLTVAVALARQGHSFICILDGKTHPVLKRYRGEQVEIFEEVLRRHPQHFSVISGSGEADYFILSQADSLNGLVLSNDKYEDYQEKYPWVLKEGPQVAKGSRKPLVKDHRIVQGGIIGNRVNVPQLWINEPLMEDAGELLRVLSEFLRNQTTNL